jgi:hypothetical protein
MGVSHQILAIHGMQALDSFKGNFCSIVFSLAAHSVK